MTTKYLHFLSLLIMLLQMGTVSAAPVIDISPMFPTFVGEESIRMACANEIRKALEDEGIFIALNAISDAESAIHMSAASALFSLPLTSKLNVALNSSSSEYRFGRGYLARGVESGLSNFREPKEGYSYGWKGNHDAMPINPLQYKNIFPSEILEDGVADILEDVFTKHADVAHAIVSALSMASVGNMDIELENIVDEANQVSLMRLFHYLPLSSVVDGIANNNDVIGSSPHTDWGFLTVIEQDQVGGLQYFSQRLKEWVDVKPIRGALVINGGDFLKQISRGQFQSPIHRVILPNISPRLSFVFFFYPNFHSTFTSFDASASNTDSSINFEYNTLLSNHQLDDTGSVNQTQFGPWVVQKWKNVFRNS